MEYYIKRQQHCRICGRFVWVSPLQPIYGDMRGLTFYCEDHTPEEQKANLKSVFAILPWRSEQK